MRKHHLIILAILALGATTASAAQAEDTVWLVNGVVPSSRVLVVSEAMSTMVFQDMSNTTSAQLNCLGVKGEGWVGPGSEDEVTSVTFPPGECVLNGTAENLKGEQVANSCTSFDKAEAVNLPWKTLLQLVNGVPYDVLLPGVGGEPGYKIECVTGLGLVSDTCTSTSGNELNVEGENEGTGVLLEFLKALLHPAEAAKCGIGGAEEGLIVGGDTLITEPLGGTIAIASTSRET